MKIAILLAAYNGEQYLEEQINSIMYQTESDIVLYVLDDGSSDRTFEILEKLQHQYGAEKIVLYKQVNQGSCKTFLNLLSNQNIQADYYAFSDQDDIWDKNKIERAINNLKNLPVDKPQLYCSIARLINEKNEIIGMLPIKKRKPSFSNSLVECFATGNTLVFNELARKIIASPGIINIAGNCDWWTCLAITACDSAIFYDKTPFLSYRIHQNNVAGFKISFITRYFKRLRRIFHNDFIKINDDHIAALESINIFMTNEAKHTLELFKKSRKGNLFHRLYYLYQSAVYREEILGTIGLYVAQIVGKI